MPTGKILIIAGMFLLIVGLIVTFGLRIPFLGKLPGDIYLKRDDYSIYLPMTSCLLVSLLISLFIWFFKK